jgi:hypothetical protein
MYCNINHALLTRFSQDPSDRGSPRYDRNQFSGLPAVCEQDIHCLLNGNFDFFRNNTGADETRAPDRRGHFEEGGRRSDEAQE